MIAEAGLAALWLAATMALMQLAMAALGLRLRQEDLVAAVRPTAIVQGALAALSFVLLIVLFLRSDMSVLLVAQNSHSAKPLLYNFAGAWGNHEGSMLLWVTVLALAGAAIALLEKKLDRATLTATLGAQAFIALGFHASLLVASSPFTRRDPPALEGLGLNPLLQDPGLAFHPPTLYFGYVGLSIAFSFSVGAMVTRDVGPVFARAMRPWVLAAWVFLTIGITAGSYWAYCELGWGGWWFWDPVENASFMPWLAATALLHSVNVLAARDGPARLDADAGGRRLLDVDGRHLPGPLGHPDQRPCLCGRSRARQFHPRPARHLYRRRTGPLWRARRAGEGGAGRHSGHRADRHALPDPRAGDGRAAFGGAALLQQGGRAGRAGACRGDGGRAAAQLAARSRQCPADQADRAARAERVVMAGTFCRGAGHRLDGDCRARPCCWSCGGELRTAVEAQAAAHAAVHLGQW
ncbi:cytochrome C assembly protein domain-containing protein [Ditylenchus destructor]|uniref:Cytochrome C assembly protein domain-containing protein n=1 Tax=Ditylenchus destructor TaxID=166010 RepID=A0AAD4ME81_9BILA|nr:cytochrome C assembly protein domain-containing protein [Ditylenchus destructor]